MSSENSALPGFLKTRIGGVLVFGLLFLVSLGLQVHSGAWSSDFGGHSDEAAHVVTSLMVRDYLAGGFLDEWHPVRYAEDYYERFPKVAIGHYPPLFYLITGLLLIPFRTPEALLTVTALMCAGAGWLTWLAGSRLLRGRGAALIISLLFCALPLVRTYTAIIMSDMLLLIFCLAATLFFGRFMNSLRVSHSLSFGLLSAMAILTKGSGLMLALVPPLAIALSGKWSLLKNWRLWMAVIPVLLLALPWMLATRHITAGGMSTQSPGSYFKDAVSFYLVGGGLEMGWIALFLLITIACWIFGKRSGVIKCDSKLIEPEEGVHWALIGGLLLLCVLVPTGFDTRYLLPMMPSALILLALRTERVLSARWAVAFPLSALALFTVVCVETWRPVEKRYTGASEAVAMTLFWGGDSLSPSRRRTVMVVSNANGEGALIAAAAFQAPDTMRVVRGSKLLASSDWLGRGYEIKFETPGDLLSIFSEQSIDYLIVDRPLTKNRLFLEHWTRLVDILEVMEGGGLVKLAGEQNSLRKHGLDSKFSVFRLNNGKIMVPHEAETGR